MKKKNQYFNRYFFIIFIILSIFYSVICYNYLRSDYKLVFEKVKSESTTLLSFMDFFMKSSGSKYFSNLIAVSTQSTLKSFLDDANEQNRKLLMDEWVNFIRGQRHSIMQITLYSEEGIELVRVDSNFRGDIRKVPFFELQNKEDQYYLKEMQNLKYKDIYISHLDLIQEKGEVIKPYEPTFRIGTVLKNSSGQKFIILLGFYWSEISDNVKRMAKVSSEGQAMIITRDSHWVAAPDERWEWSGVIPGREIFKFKNIYPEAWKRVSDYKQGLFIVDEGMFSYSAINIQRVFTKFLAQNKINDFKVDLPVNKKRLLLLIHHVSKKRVFDIFYNRNIDLIYFFAFCFIAIVPAAITLSGWIRMLLVHRKQLLMEAQFDDLTGLKNRRKLNNELEELCQDKKSFSLFFIDLDEFKKVNDLYGHAAGDHVLKEIAIRLGTCVRKTDTLARLGGDEMVAVLVGLDSYNEAKKVASHLLEKISRPFIVSGNNVVLGASIGIVLFKGDNYSPKEIVRLADKAMYAAKNKGKNCFVFSSEI